MARDLISIKTRQAFREFLVGWTLREIADKFDAAGVPCDLEYQPPVAGQRRSFVEQYYHAVDWTNWSDVRKVLHAYENIITRVMQFVRNIEPWDQITAERERTRVGALIEWLRKDGFVWVDGRIISGPGMPSLDHIKEMASSFDAKYLAEQIRRMEQSVEADPTLAIGTAKELVETCCYTILAERGKPVRGKPDIPALAKATLKELGLVPEGIPEVAKGSEIIKRLLSNLATIVQGLAELRGLYGTGHGKEWRTRSLKSRHAKLAVGAAATLATFLFETHKEKAP